MIVYYYIIYYARFLVGARGAAAVCCFVLPSHTNYLLWSVYILSLIHI